jgi:PAS domain S-box-containing protein
MSSAEQKLAESAALAYASYEALRERLGDPGGIDAPMVRAMLEELALALAGLDASTREIERQYEALRASEVELARERERYRDLFEFGPDGVFLTDAMGKIRALNQVAARMIGAPANSLIGKRLPVFVSVADRGRFRHLVNRLRLEDCGVQTMEVTLTTRHASFPAEIRVAQSRAPAGPPELRWLVRDISIERENRDRLAAEVARRGRAEETLDRSERRYRHLVEHATDIIYELDANGSFTYCNGEAVSRILGYRSEELIGRRLIDLVPEEHRENVRAFRRRQAARPGGDNYLEFPVLAKDGRTVWLGQHVSVTGGPRDRHGLQAVCRDVTPHLKALGKLSADMRDWSLHLQEQVEAERTRIARDIHDELGAVLTGLRMELSLSARAGEAAAPIGRREKLLRRIDAALEATRRICSDLRPSLLDNMGLCAAIEWLAQDVQQRSQIRCKLSLDGLPAEPDSARGTALYRIVQEATTNVIRHAQASAIVIVQSCHNGSVRITVSDNGRGITPQQRTGRKSFGLLGMQERARAFGGSVQIDGGRKGTRVRIEMPLATNDKVEANESAAG